MDIPYSGEQIQSELSLQRKTSFAPRCESGWIVTGVKVGLERGESNSRKSLRSAFGSQFHPTIQSKKWADKSRLE
ncbi:hypothetical protein V7139_27595, partial [Neobacillus drentensis]|uniref:hypothetical protein n=1 Tax=Neobacillus drentensis TaxID=220684 RepID=UPI00300289F2